MDAKFASRKFILAALSLLCSTALCAFGRLTPDTYATLLVGINGAYFAANATQNILTNKESTNG